MRSWLKTSLWCLFVALGLNAAFNFAQPQPEIPFDPPWLQISCSNPGNNMKLKPQWTVIITSIKPSVHQVDVNRWEIYFSN